MRLTSACAVLTMEAARWSLLLALRKETFAAATASSSVDDPTAKLHYNRQNPLKLDQLPDTGEEWQTLSNGIQVQPASNLSPLAQEHLRRLTSTGSNGTDWETSAYEKMFVDGAETYYDEYAQAWRALGFYIDCDYCDPDRGCWYVCCCKACETFRTSVVCSVVQKPHPFNCCFVTKKVGSKQQQW